jgi:hypothetical protein
LFELNILFWEKYFQQKIINEKIINFLLFD